MRHGAARHALRGARAAHVDVAEPIDILAEMGLDLQDDPVLVQRREHRGHLPLAEGIIERVVDRLGADAQPRRRAAVDG
jgi:hypothetical protein